MSKFCYLVNMMIKKTFIILWTVAVALVATGCLDWETEVRILPDGSGILTSWISTDRRDALLGASLLDRDIHQEIDKMVFRLQDAAKETGGVNFLDYSLLEEGEKLVLRYRYVFDHIGALNNFWRSQDAKQIPFLLADSRLDFKSGGGLCGVYGASIKVEPRTPDHMLWPMMGDFARLDDATFSLLLEKIYSGVFRFRLALPGEMKAGDAKKFDIRSRPVYETTLSNLFHVGLRAKVGSELPCPKAGDKAKVEDPDEGDRSISYGRTPKFSDLLFAVRTLPRFVHTSIDIEQISRRKAHVRVEIEAKEPMADAFRFYLPLLLTILPTAIEDMELTTETRDGSVFYRMKTRKAFDFQKLKSSAVFVGRDKSRDVFRMRLPIFPVFGDSSEGEAVEMLRISIRLKHEITMSNAAQIKDREAVWRLTDRMLSQKVVLEALSQ